MHSDGLMDKQIFSPAKKRVCQPHYLNGRSSSGIIAGPINSVMPRAWPRAREMNPRCSSRISIELTDGAVRLKKRCSTAWVGATPA